MNQSSADAGIPLLTEVLPNLPVLTEVIAAPPSRPRAAETAAAEIVAAPAAPMPQAGQLEPVPPTTSSIAAPRDEERWARMEREVGERVLQQVLHRVDLVLEQRVRDSLADVLQLAVDRLATEIRGGLQQSLKEAISDAIAQEIAKQRNGEI